MHKWMTWCAMSLLAGLVLTHAPAPAAAAEECKGSITAIGSAALTLDGAKRNAIKNWQRAVVAKYGEFWGNFDKARESAVAPCGKTLIGLQRCEAKGRPCLGERPVDSDNLPGEIECKSGDSKNCDERVKWLQSKLAAFGCSPGKVDGADGPNTKDAIKCAQRKLKIEENGELTSALIDKLKSM